MLKPIYHVLLRLLKAISIRELRDYVDTLVQDHAEENQFYERMLSEAMKTNAKLRQELREVHERINEVNGEVDDA